MTWNIFKRGFSESVFLTTPIANVQLGSIVIHKKEMDYTVNSHICSLLDGDYDENEKKLAPIFSLDGKRVFKQPVADTEIDRIVKNTGAANFNAHVGEVQVGASLNLSKEQLLRLRLSKSVKYTVDINALEVALCGFKFAETVVELSYVFVQAFISSASLTKKVFDVTKADGKLTLNLVPDVAGGSLGGSHEASNRVEFTGIEGERYVHWMLLRKINIRSVDKADIQKESVGGLVTFGEEFCEVVFDDDDVDGDGPASAGAS